MLQIVTLEISTWKGLSIGVLFYTYNAISDNWRCWDWVLPF